MLYLVNNGCLGSQCANGSTCVPLSDKDYLCQCPPGRRGKLCDEGKARDWSLIMGRGATKWKKTMGLKTFLTPLNTLVMLPVLKGGNLYCPPSVWLKLFHAPFP